MVEEHIFYSYELPEEYLDELTAALSGANADSNAENICGLIEKMNYKILDNKTFLSAAAAVVAQLSEETYAFFKRKAERDMDAKETSKRVKLFYGAIL